MTTDYLAEVLQLAPSTWTRATYTASNYVTENLYEYSEEYKNIVRALPSNLAESIRRVERVQHPFAYGRFVLRKEQLENRDGVKRVPVSDNYICYYTSSQLHMYEDVCFRQDISCK